MSECGLRQVVVHPAVWDRLEAYLRKVNVQLVEIPTEEEGDIPTYIMSPIDF